MSNNSYNGNPKIKADGVQQSFTQHEVQEYIRCSQSVEYFCKNYVKVISLDHGLVPFELRGYQSELVKCYSENSHSIVLSSRQSGKSITTVAWILHYLIFNADKKVALLANKGAIAREMLARLTLMLENLPFFLQPGVRVLNKGNIVFAHNSEIIAASTSSSSIRGISANCVTSDTKICVLDEDSVFYSEIEKIINKSRFIQKEMTKKYTVYKITNKINGKIYIGYHATYDLNDGYMGSGKNIIKAIEKYGIQNFEKEILFVFDSKEEAEKMEASIVNEEFVKREDTYNIVTGGNICVLYGEANGFYGKKHSPETIKKMKDKAESRPIRIFNGIKNGSEFYYSIADAINKINFHEDLTKHAKRCKILFDCGDPLCDMHFVDKEQQTMAEEYYKRRVEFNETSKFRRDEGALKRSSLMKGKKRPKEFGEKISRALIGHKKNKETIDKINRNPEKIRKTAEKHRGMKRSEESRQKMSEAKRGSVAKNKGKKYYRNPENLEEGAYFFPDEVPSGWINKVKIK